MEYAVDTHVVRERLMVLEEVPDPDQLEGFGVIAGLEVLQADHLHVLDAELAHPFVDRRHVPTARPRAVLGQALPRALAGVPDVEEPVASA